MRIPVLPKRSRSLAAVVLLPALLATGCGAGFEAQTNKAYQSAEGANGDSGSLAARNVLIVADEAGKGVLHGVLVNTGDTDDRLASIAVDPSVEGVKLTGSAPVPLPAGQAVTISGGSSGDGEAATKTMTVTGAKPGRMIKLTISFGDAGPITTSVPVITEDHYSPSPRAAAEG